MENKKVDKKVELYAFRLLSDELMRYKNIFIKDREDNFANEYFLTSIDCHLEDLGIRIEELEEEVESEL